MQPWFPVRQLCGDPFVLSQLPQIGLVDVLEVLVFKRAADFEDKLWEAFNIQIRDDDIRALVFGVFSWCEPAISE